jgi:AcrR family transcriptional regulator
MASDSEHAQTRSTRVDGRRNRERIVTTARALLAEDGHVPLERIARAAGVGSATLHRHFGSRLALLEAVFHQEVVDLCAVGESTLAAHPPDTAVVLWLEEVAAHAAATNELGHLILSTPGGAIAPEDTCHGLMYATTLALLRRRDASANTTTDVLAEDLLTIANALGSAVAGDARRARELTRLAAGSAVATTRSPLG